MKWLSGLGRVRCRMEQQFLLAVARKFSWEQHCQYEVKQSNNALVCDIHFPSKIKFNSLDFAGFVLFLLLFLQPTDAIPNTVKPLNGNFYLLAQTDRYLKVNFQWVHLSPISRYCKLQANMFLVYAGANNDYNNVTI